MDFVTALLTNPVQYVWIVAALPLAALIVNFFGVRWLDVAAQRRRKLATATTGGHDAHGAGAAHDHEEEEHGGGHGHGGPGGPTPAATAVSWIATGALALAFALSCLIGYQFLAGGEKFQSADHFTHIYDWFKFGNLTYSIDFRVDPLTVVMLVVVTGVSMLVHLYSIGYMGGDPGYSRFFIELSLFTFSMLVLVLGANFLVLFIGWELVGLSSYLLIGFFYGATPPPPGSEVPYPPPAQLKAFVTTRLGDFGFLIGILILFTTTGTFDFLKLNTATHNVSQPLITIAMVLVFCGAVGKSAQFPLHVWLPDAMAGPTPVSALIHAATMVAAGVYLVARLFPIYAEVAGPESLAVVGGIGAFTALFAATIALTQHDIKGVLAYSTISQLGYMFSGLAVAETNAIGINHLFTHAFFKALLFLGSGSVIHAVAAQDMRKMGGLARFLPITALTFLVANLAIAGIPGFSGFWSKDPIIAAAFERGNYLIYGALLFTAFLTAFYMFRLFFLTFGGRGGALGGLCGGEYRGEGHPHESPPVMTIPLVILAAVTVFIGVWGFFGYDNAFATFLHGGKPVTYSVTPGLDLNTLLGVGAGVLGIGLAWGMYGAGTEKAAAFVRNPLVAPVHRLLYNRYYLNELYGFLIRYVVLGLSTGFALFDKYVIDGLVNGAAQLVLGVGKVTRRSETGFLSNYGAAIFGGALLIMIALFLAVGALGR